MEPEFRRSSFCADKSCVEVAFETSSHCTGGACVEVAFEKSSFCGNGACVEVARHPGAVLMRDGKDQAGPVLRVDAEGWDDFLRGVRNGEFDG